MSSLETICDAGCGKPFTVFETITLEIRSGIVEASFTCPHCQRKYVMFYTDPEIRKLQRKIQKVLGQRVSPNLNYAEAVRQEKKIQKQANKMKGLIAEKMDLLRTKIE